MTTMNHHLGIAQDYRAATEHDHFTRISIAISDWLNEYGHERSPMLVQEFILDMLETAPAMETCDKCSSYLWVAPLSEGECLKQGMRRLNYTCPECGKRWSEFYAKAADGCEADSWPTLNRVWRNPADEVLASQREFKREEEVSV